MRIDFDHALRLGQVHEPITSSTRWRRSRSFSRVDVEHIGDLSPTFMTGLSAVIAPGRSCDPGAADLAHRGA